MGRFSYIEHRMRTTAISVIIGLVAQNLPFNAFASDPVPPKSTTKVAIVGLRSGKIPSEEKIRKMITEKLTSKETKVVDDAAVAKKLETYMSSEVDPKSQAAVASAYEHYNTGLQYYWKLDLTNALKEFNLAVRGYREGISLLRDNYYLLFSHLYLGITLYFLGRTEEGKKFIQEMAMLDPIRAQRVLPTRDFPPKVVELQKQITDEIAQKPMANLNIDTVPPGAVVIFNGSEVGKTPMQINDVPVGQHFLALDMTGYQFYAAPIQVNAGAQNFITPLKEKNIFHTYPSPTSQNSKDQLQNLAEVLEVDFLILGQIVTKGSNLEVQTQTFNADTGVFSEMNKETTGNRKIVIQATPSKIKKQLTETTEVANSAATAGQKTKPEEKKTDLIEKTEKKEPEKSTKTESTKPVPTKDSLMKNSTGTKSNSPTSDFDEPKKKSNLSSESSPFYKKWWFWGAVGVVAAGAGAYFFLMKGDDPATSNVLTITNPL